MTMNLMFANRCIDLGAKAKADWAALTAISATDPTSPYPTEAYVSVDAGTVVRIAALLDGKQLMNGEIVTTHDFSFSDGDYSRVEAHVNSFGPSLLDAGTLAALRAELAPHPVATAMLDQVIARGLQITMSTELLDGLDHAHVKGVNWMADEIEINLTTGSMHEMLRDLGLDPRTSAENGSGEIEFKKFRDAVHDKSTALFMSGRLLRLSRFVGCAERQDATHVYWA